MIYYYVFIIEFGLIVIVNVLSVYVHKTQKHAYSVPLECQPMEFYVHFFKMWTFIEYSIIKGISIHQTN